MMKIVQEFEIAVTKPFVRDAHNARDTCVMCVNCEFMLFYNAVKVKAKTRVCVCVLTI